MTERKQVQSTDVRRSTKATTQPAENTSQPSSDVTALQHIIGNHAIQRLLAEGHPTVAPKIQTKLHVGAADDSYEHEADTVASAVMNMSDMSVQRAGEEEIMTKRVDVQRVGGAGDEDEVESEEVLTKRAGVDMMGEFDIAGDVETGIQNLAGGGQGLADSARDFFEPRFGHSFENVHVHTGGDADSLNRSIQARAFTKGSDIYFASGEYEPDSSGGRALLAHELTHVIQQTGGSPTRN